jgi:hypothetical protein
MGNISEHKEKRIDTLKDLVAAFAVSADVDLVAEREIPANAKRASALLGKLKGLYARDLRAEEKRRENDAIGTVMTEVVEGAAEKRLTDDFDVPLAEDTQACRREISVLLGKIHTGLRSQYARSRAEVHENLDALEVAVKEVGVFVEKLVDDIRARQSGAIHTVDQLLERLTTPGK